MLHQRSLFTSHMPLCRRKLQASTTVPAAPCPLTSSQQQQASQPSVHLCQRDPCSHQQPGCPSPRCPATREPSYQRTALAVLGEATGV